jgi:DNA-binding beta-propeller fold protein YncE
MLNARCNYRRSCLLAAGMLFLAGPLAAQIQTSPLAGQSGTAIIIA